MSVNYLRARNMFDLFDDIFSNVFNESWELSPGRFNKQISSSSFPPTNISIGTESKVMTIQAALAGIKEEQINLSFDGDYLKLIVDTPTTENDKNYFFQQGLKTISHFETKWGVDPRYFDREKVKVDFSNGLLTITIPPKEEVATKKIPLFGKLRLEDKT